MSAVSQPDHLLGPRVLPPSADIGRRDNEVRRGGGHGQREKGRPRQGAGAARLRGPRANQRRATRHVLQEGRAAGCRGFLTNGCAWNAVSAFANCGRAAAHVRGSYVPIVL